jgi:hypothetical protein
MNAKKDGIVGEARLEHGGRVSVNVSLPLADYHQPAADPDLASAGDPAARAAHAPGFESVYWYGVTYTFTGKQRLVVAALWQAREQGYHWIDQAGLLDIAESEQRRLRDLFDQGRHPAWGTLIVQATLHGGPTGSYGLAPEGGRG